MAQGLAQGSQNAIAAIEAELQFEVMNANVVNGFAYASDRIVADATDKEKQDQSTPNVIARKNLPENKWAIYTKPLQAGIQSVYGDVKAPLGNAVEFASCNAGVNTIDFTVGGYGHNTRKAFRQVISDPAGMARDVMRNQSVPKINFEFFLGMTRGASDCLFSDSFSPNGGGAVYGVTANNAAGNPFHSWNFGSVNGDTVALIGKNNTLLNTLWDNGVSWNAAVNTFLYNNLPTAAGGGASTAISLMPTYKTITKLERYATENRIMPIKGRAYSYVYFCTPAQAQNIIDTLPNIRTQITEAPENVKLLGWTSYIVNRTLVVGTPWINTVWLMNTVTSSPSAANARFDYGVSKSGSVITANFSTPDIYGQIAAGGGANYVPNILCGQDACLTGDDWNLRFTEDAAISNPEREGINYFLDIDTGFVRAEYRRPQANLRDVNGNPTLELTYKNCIVNQNSMTFATYTE